ncbi:hypothetical protein CBR_g23283 [Chara braunii]|uniref:Myb-like domain-containing protein n=1 Tax=Chara braunii TaxID=69332 RepID=A0A388JVC0_CHABU|nr:hypothetical protein CBR_g23283 [Chara braunii]|eukprot:GBG61769.1 hypothetical protein CBR_g23283 [Chara braunii]
MRSPSPVYVASNLGRRGGIVAEGGGNLDDVGDNVDGRLLWAEQRRELREGREEAIRRGVERLRIDRPAKEVEEPDAGLPFEEDDDENEGEGGDGNGGYASPSENSDVGVKGGNTKAKSGNGRGRPKKPQAKQNDGDGNGKAKEKRNFWSVERIIALIRAKHDQDAHLQGMGHVYGRMKAREWKWNDVARRLKNAGVDRKADKCGKKWDNLMQQFKKVHHFQSPSGGIDFFQLSAKERVSKGFNFNMDRAVYDKIEVSTGFNETINPKNVADTGASRGVHLPSASNADPEAVGDADAGAGGDDEEERSTRGSSQTAGSPGAFGKRKSTRQQTFKAMTDCMEKHGPLMAVTMESASKRQCSIQLRQCVGKQVSEGELVPKKGRHDPAKRRRGVQGGKGVVGREVELEWVDEEERQEEDEDFQEEEDQTLKRKVKQRTGGAIRIEVGGGDAAEVAHDQPQIPSNKRNQQPVGVASSSQAVIDVSAKRSPALQPRGETVQVLCEVADGAKASDVQAVGEDDEAVVNKLRGQSEEAKAIEVAARLWTDDICFWNQTRGHEII